MENVLSQCEGTLFVVGVKGEPESHCTPPALGDCQDSMQVLFAC